MMAAQIEIHGYTLCPFAWRCRLAASEKGVKLRLVAPRISPNRIRAARRTIRTSGSPLLRHGDFTVTDSAVIVSIYRRSVRRTAANAGGGEATGADAADHDRAFVSIMVDDRKGLDDEAKARSKRGARHPGGEIVRRRSLVGRCDAEPGGSGDLAVSGDLAAQGRASARQAASRDSRTGSACRRATATARRRRLAVERIVKALPVARTVPGRSSWPARDRRSSH